MVKNSPPKEDIDFQGKHAGEHFQFYFRQHWIRLMPPAGRLILINALLFTMGYTIFVLVGVEEDAARRSILGLLATFFVVAHLEFLTRFYRYFLYTLIVTDKKIHRIKKTFLAIDDHQSIDVWMLQDIFKCQHGIVQNIFGYGTLTFEAQETSLRIHFVPSINKRYNQLLHLREQARTRMVYSAQQLNNMQSISEVAKEGEDMVAGGTDE
jgi:hypothetical protein